MNIKKCSTCKEEKDFSAFGKNKNGKHGLAFDCKSCASNWSKKYRADNPKKYRDSKLKTDYGISLEQYNIMLEKQKGVCSICYKPEVGKALAVDHCHRTLVVRGLLCQKCNTSLGKMEDSPDRLRRAAAYLEEFIND